MTKINLGKLYDLAFGYHPPKNKFIIPKASPRKEISSLGQPYYMEDAMGREFFMPVTLDGYLIPFAVIAMNWKKTYVSTKMPERGGSVKELINVDDYVFSLKGICISSNNDFPESQIIDLHNIFRKNQSVTLKSALSAIVLSGEFDERVVITDVRWPEMPGVEHARAFDMTLESDMIFDLIIS